MGEPLQSDDALMAKKLADRISPIVNIPIQFDWYQKAGPQHNTYQERVVLQPLVPIAVTEDWNYLVRPVITGGLQYQAGTVTNQTTPLQVETFLSPGHDKPFKWGIGPYFQFPGIGVSNGTLQYGAGVSAGAFWETDRWVIGAIGYNSWATGGSARQGTANVLYVSPSISYITESAWTYTATMQPSFNYTAGSTSNPLLLLASKTTKINGLPVQFLAGPSYMISTTATSAQGWGFRAQLQFAFPE